MENREDRDVRVVAMEMVRRFGAYAAQTTQSWSHLNRQAGEEEAAQFWPAVARFILSLQGGEASRRSKAGEIPVLAEDKALANQNTSNK